ncbi:MAG: hypothetical protein PHE25_04305 [Candidatus Gracilibacteria bacterium]|nr:hypothetical protein [Candidatus Gracilibacteria bacterium]
MKRFNAKLKNDTHVKIFSSDSELEKINFYSIPNIENEVEYNFNTKLENDEWFFVNLSSEQISSMIDEYKTSITGSGELNKITKDNYDDIEVCYLVEDNKIIFTKIIKSYFVRSTKFLGFSDLGPEIIEQQNSITFNGQVDVYFDGTNKLYFKSYTRAKSIFDGLSDFYRTASQEEVNTFLEKDFFVIKDNFDKSKLGDRLHKNIAKIIDDNNINFTDLEVRTKYNNYATTFLGENIQINQEGKFEIEKNKDLTNVVKLLQGHYYLDYIDPEKKMETNFSKPLNN